MAVSISRVAERIASGVFSSAVMAPRTPWQRIVCVFKPRFSFQPAVVKNSKSYTFQKQ
jgi:hypothetical protein